MSAFKGKTNTEDFGSIIWKSWNRSSSNSVSKNRWTGNILKYAQENSAKKCQVWEVNKVIKF